MTPRTRRLHPRAALTATALALLAGTVGAQALPTAVVNFESNPALATAPSIYVAVPGPQTFTTPQATFTGGVALGFATFFPAIAFATPPNVYGTADFGNGLARALTITVDPAFTTTEVSFALFNGETFAQGYQVDAFNGNALVASQTLAPIAPNFNSGYALVDVLAAGGISRVTIAPTGSPQAWDFLIDTVAFNQSITQVVPVPPPVVQPAVAPVQGHRHGHKKGEVELLEVNFGDDLNDIRGQVLVVNAPVPEPHTWALLLAGGALLGWRARRARTR